MLGLMLMGLLGVAVVMVCVPLVLLQLMRESLEERMQPARPVANPAPVPRRPPVLEEDAPVSQRLRELCGAIEHAPLSQRFSAPLSA
jgi:hypothetical protein